MLKQKHYLYDKIYKINTVVGFIDKDSIEEIEYVGITEDKKHNKLIIIDYGNEYESEYTTIENNRFLFDTKEEAEHYIGFYNNGNEFLKLVKEEK